MTREEAKQLLPIIQAFTEGKTIISRKKCKEAVGKDGWSEFNDWEDCKTPTFDIENFDYRIKPSPTCRPFKNAEECWNEMQKHHPFGWVSCKENNVKVLIRAIEPLIVFTSVAYSLDDAFKYLAFADGAKFGIKE